jgi:hypothetical protein
VVNSCVRDYVLDKSCLCSRADHVTKRTIRLTWNRISMSNEGRGSTLLEFIAARTIGQQGQGGAW